MAQEIAEHVLRKVTALGADSADLVFVQQTQLTVAQRLGKVEKSQRAEASALSVRAFVGQRQAIVSTSDVSRDALDLVAARAVEMARAVPEDPYCGLADPRDLAREFPEIESADPIEPAQETLGRWAKDAEESALAESGITNSEGAECGWTSLVTSLANSAGFWGESRTTRYGLSVSVIAGEGTAMEVDGDYASAVYATDLEDPVTLGKSAARRALRKLNPRKISSGRMPVVFDARVASSLLGHFAGAINGSAVARGASFLKDRMKSEVFAPAVTIVDDPLRRRGLGSATFDGEGLPMRPLVLVENGVLQHWLLDCRSARQLGLYSNGRAHRGMGSAPLPGATNLYMQAGERGPEDLLSGIREGLFVTDLIGFGVNAVTGDYSRGASGHLIENGQIGPAVAEITIAGNLRDMFMHTIPANDLKFRYRTNAPTLLVEGMTVAGR
ncbi:MAG TPA: TldD/PmbA family protein [Dongiaceae bacterium]|jgi:PmbA protein|nr:TldD/PmbA family protein [Dongiaceae bacterium]